MTTATRSRIVYLVACDRFWIGEADDRARAEEIRDGHAAHNSNDPLSDRYEITPIIRNRKEGD